MDVLRYCFVYTSTTCGLLNVAITLSEQNIVGLVSAFTFLIIVIALRTVHSKYCSFLVYKIFTILIFIGETAVWCLAVYIYSDQFVEKLREYPLRGIICFMSVCLLFATSIVADIQSYITILEKEQEKKEKDEHNQPPPDYATTVKTTNEECPPLSYASLQKY